MVNQSISRDERNFAMYCHLGSLAGVICPPLNIVATLIIWLSKRDESEFINQQGKEALNFQITLLIMYMIATLLIILIVGIPLLILLGIYNLVMPIIAIIKVNEGIEYRYPFRFKLV
ncbi:MAG: DUF4870 domain-containing protein [Calditrichaeota bacterium]|nr:DUF4870 domain-containing protein [Calditrichota bacterium]